MATARSIAPRFAAIAVDLESLADGRGVPNRRVRFGTRQWRLGSVLRGDFTDSQHTKYYASPARCGGGKGKEKVKEKEKVAKKENNKKLKLLKRLSEDLQMYASGKEDGGMAIMEAQKVLLAELEGLRSAEMERKRKSDEEKELERAIMKPKDCCESESSDSSSSSESSDSDCEDEKVMMMKSQRKKSDSAITQDIGTIQPIGVLQEEREERNGDVFATFASTVGALSRKIEVCVGGKCKKQGALELMDQFQRKVGREATVMTCKCLGKCKNAPNVRVSSSCSADGFQELDGIAEKLLCIGVGLEDVDAIVANLLGEGTGSPPAMAAASV
ncbi:unnamed protein product [Linum tenue]|uniref:Uncharacterized protein n=1 Tax=Linum tenue TaxID=586396 RepID=A0AAV0PHW2_9ROSI|nr:unnamed protein product [Linum tenue]